MRGIGVLALVAAWFMVFLGLSRVVAAQGANTCSGRVDLGRRVIGLRCTGDCTDGATCAPKQVSGTVFACYCANPIAPNGCLLLFDTANPYPPGCLNTGCTPACHRGVVDDPDAPAGTLITWECVCK